MSEAEQARVFTPEEHAAAAHLQALVNRQIGMGVPPAMALGVLATTLGMVAAEQGLQRENLSTLHAWTDQAYDGASKGFAERPAAVAEGT